MPRDPQLKLRPRGNILAPEGPCEMIWSDWRKTLKPLPIWRGWKLEERTEGLGQAHFPAFEPAEGQIEPSWEIMSGAAEKSCWRIENEFDKTLSDNGFQGWQGTIASNSCLRKLRIFKLEAESSKNGNAKQAGKITCKYEGFKIKTMVPVVRVYLMASKFTRLHPGCERQLEQLRSEFTNSTSGTGRRCGDYKNMRILLNEFIDRFGEWFTTSITLGGCLSDYHSAASVEGHTMDEKESKVVAGLSMNHVIGGVDASFDTENKRSSVETRSLRISQQSTERLGGTPSATVELFENSLKYPANWRVIDRGSPEMLFDVIKRLDGWRNVGEMVKTIADSAPVPHSLVTQPNQHFSFGTSFASFSVVRRGLAFIFFQDSDDWIRWGYYDVDNDEDFVFSNKIVKAQRSTPLACCRCQHTHENPNYIAVHVFFVSTHGKLADQCVTISRESPPAVSSWLPGKLEKLGLDVIPGTRLSANYAAASDRLAVCFERKETHVSSKIYAAYCGHWRTSSGWDLRAEPLHSYETLTGSQLSLFPDERKGKDVTILYQSAGTGTIHASSTHLMTDRATETQELSSLLSDNGYKSDAKLAFAVNPHVPDDDAIYAAVRSVDNRVVIWSYTCLEDEGYSLKAEPFECKTAENTEFCLTLVNNKKLVLYYIAPQGQIAAGVIDLGGPLKSARHTYRPVFGHDCRLHPETTFLGNRL